MGKYQSGQMGQTVNLLAYAFGGSNPSLPTGNQIVIERSCLIFFFMLPSSIDNTSQLHKKANQLIRANWLNL